MINWIQHGSGLSYKMYFYHNQNEQGKELWLFSSDLLGIFDSKMGEIPESLWRFQCFTYAIDVYVECLDAGTISSKAT